MAGRTRRGAKSTTTETPEVEVTEVPEAQPENDQEGATEAPEINEEADVTTVADETQTEAQEPEATEPQAEAPAENVTENTEPQAAEAQPEAKTPEALFQSFKDTVGKAVELADTTTSTVPEAEVAKVLDAYRALPNATTKTAAKTWIADIMRERLMEQDMNGATAYANVNKAVLDVGARRTSTGPTKPQVSPTEAYVERVVALALANKFTPMPEGLDENWVNIFNDRLDKEGQQVDAYKAYLAEHTAWAAKPEADRGDEPKEPEGISQVLRDAAKLGQGKAATRRSTGGTRRSSGVASGTRRDVKKHIQEFLASVEDGSEHPVSAIANYKSSEYPDGDASPGAVAARLFPNDGKPSTIEGFEQVEGPGTRKVRKLAA